MPQPRNLPRPLDDEAPAPQLQSGSQSTSHAKSPASPHGEAGRQDVLKRLEKVLPFVAPKFGEKPGDKAGERRDWGDALDLVRQAADAMRAKEAHVEEIEASTRQVIERAYEEVSTFKTRLGATEARCTQAELKLKAAETRLDEAETRAARAEARAAQAEARIAAAEARAQEAEEWLSRIHSAVVEGFAKPA